MVKDLSQLGILYTDRRDFYLGDFMVRELWTDVAPFTTIASNRGVKGTTDPDFKMFEHRSGWVKQQMSVKAVGDPAVVATWPTSGKPGEEITIGVDGFVGVNSSLDESMIGLMVECWKSDFSAFRGVARIQKLGATAGTIVLQAIGKATDADFEMDNLADDDVLVVVGNAFGEGGYAPEAYADDLEVIYNSCQEFKTPIEVTGTLYQAALRGYSSELQRLRLEKGREHKIQKERNFLFGVRSGGTGSKSLAGTALTDSHALILKDKDGKNLRTTMGLISAIQRYGASTGDNQNLFTIDNTYTYNKFVDDMEKVFQYLPDSGEKVAFCGAGALSYWSKVGATNQILKNSGVSVQLDNFQRSEWGFNYRRLITPHGNLRLVPTPVLRGPYSKTMVVVDDSDFELRQYRPFVFKTNVKTDNAYDGVKDLYFSDEGVAISMIEKHSLWTISAVPA
jgi:hypothetical protein